MDLDIQAEHVAMHPAWYREIDQWVAGCARHHPGVAAVELTLRHGDGGPLPDEVCAVATGRDRRPLRATARAGLMAEALHEALDTLEHDLLVHEALRR